MFKPGRLPKRLQGLITDDAGDSVCFEGSGSYHVVDDRTFRWEPGCWIVRVRVAVIDSARVKVDGALKVTVVGQTGRAAKQPSVTAQGAEVTAIRGSPFVRLLAGSQGLLYSASRFEAQGNAQARLNDDASGIARDESEIFFEESSRGEVLVLSNRVRLVTPRGFRIEERDTKRGIIAKLAR
jgi:hypothetical protein